MDEPGPRSLITTAAALLAATGLSVCGKSPSQSTPATPPPITAPPATQPTPPPTTCSRLGYVSPSNNCSSDAATFQPQVEQAMDLLVAQHPEIFNLSETSGTGLLQAQERGGRHPPPAPPLGVRPLLDA